MAQRGRHTKEAVRARQQATYEPSFEVPTSNPDQLVPRALILALIVALVALVPLSLGRIAASIDAHAYADSERTAFPMPADTGVEQPAASFGLFFDVLAGESDASGASVEDVPAAPVRYTDNVGSELQNAILEGGCELVALDMTLDAMGLDADIIDIVDNHLTIDGHFATGYSGSPYFRGGGFPQGVVKAANGYLTARGEAPRAHDLTGVAFGSLLKLVDKGYPVLVWTTMGYVEPDLAGVYDEGMEWYNNEHCVVLYGHSDDEVLLSDPLVGKTSCELTRFQAVYGQCGSMAAAVY